MEKDVLYNYADAKARIKHLQGTIERLSKKIEKLEDTDYGFVGDTVSRGKRGKKALGTVKISGFPVPEYQKAVQQLRIRKVLLEDQELKLLELTNEVEEFIQAIKDIELQNIFTLYYIEDLMWVQVAVRMNELYENKHYTADSCRIKHERFLKKF